jgi:hypothetical protein
MRAGSTQEHGPSQQYTGTQCRSCARAKNACATHACTRERACVRAHKQASAHADTSACPCSKNMRTHTHTHTHTHTSMQKKPTHNSGARVRTRVNTHTHAYTCICNSNARAAHAHKTCMSSMRIQHACNAHALPVGVPCSDTTTCTRASDKHMICICASTCNGSARTEHTRA